MFYFYHVCLLWVLWHHIEWNQENLSPSFHSLCMWASGIWGSSHTSPPFTWICMFDSVFGPPIPYPNLWEGKKKAKEKSKRLSRLQHGLFNHNSLCTLFITKTTKTILRHIVISFHSHPPTHSTQNLSSTVTLSIFKANSNLQIPSDKKLYMCN